MSFSQYVHYYKMCFLSFTAFGPYLEWLTFFIIQLRQICLIINLDGFYHIDKEFPYFKKCWFDNYFTHFCVTRPLSNCHSFVFHFVLSKLASLDEAKESAEQLLYFGRISLIVLFFPPQL